jgi:hypothetical protein
MQFLGPRSTYYYNAFFDLLSGDAASHNPTRFLDDAEDRVTRLVRQPIVPGSARVVDLLPQYAGFVAVPVEADDLARIAPEHLTGAYV